MSTPPELPVELSASYAHRTGEDVRVVLQLAGGAAPDAAALQLRAGRRVLQVASTSRSTAEGELLEARLPAADLRPGVWRLALVGADQDVRPLEARLLNSRKQPIALLPGPTPRTELAPPERVVPVAVAPRRARVYRAASRIADAGLAVLPESRAQRYRAALRKAGHRVLG
jgi:hypothetical protein